MFQEHSFPWDWENTYSWSVLDACEYPGTQHGWAEFWVTVRASDLGQTVFFGVLQDSNTSRWLAVAINIRTGSILNLHTWQQIGQYGGKSEDFLQKKGVRLRAELCRENSGKFLVPDQFTWTLHVGKSSFDLTRILQERSSIIVHFYVGAQDGNNAGMGYISTEVKKGFQYKA